MTLWAIYLFDIVLCIGLSCAVYFLSLRRSMKSFKYVILWAMWIAGVSTRLIGEMSFLSDSMDLAIRSISLVVNATTYIHLSHIFKEDLDVSKSKAVSYLTFFIELSMWHVASLMVGGSVVLLLAMNVSVILKTAVVSIKYKRPWFAISCLFSGMWFFLAAYTLSMGHEAYPFSWALHAVAAVCAIMGTYTNGGAHDRK